MFVESTLGQAGSPCASFAPDGEGTRFVCWCRFVSAWGRNRPVVLAQRCVRTAYLPAQIDMVLASRSPVVPETAVRVDTYDS